MLVLTLLRRWAWVLIAFAASRLIIVFLTRLSRMIFMHGEFWQRNGITGMLVQGDAERYLQIATAGYGSGSASVADAGFYPVYPGLVRMFSLLLEPATAALLISNIALLASGILLKELVEALYKQPRVSSAAVAFLMFSPLSFLLSGAYPESTFLVFTLGAFTGATKGRWFVASLCGAAAALTISVGVLLAVPLAIECFRSAKSSSAPSTSVLKPVALLSLIPLSFGAFLLFSHVRFGDALAPLHAAAAWAGGVVAPWTTIGGSELLPKFYRHFSLLMLGCGSALCVAGILLRVRASLVVFAGALLVVYTSTASIASIARELNVLFPLFIILALLSRRFDWAYEPLLAASVTIFSFCTLMAANGHWMR